MRPKSEYLAEEETVNITKKGGLNIYVHFKT